MMREKWDERRGSTTWGGYTIKQALQTYNKMAPNEESISWLSELDRTNPDIAPEHPDTSAAGNTFTADEVLHLINQYAEEDNRERITVLPLMCGTGKSTAIRMRIKQVIDTVIANDNTGDGMIVVTDNISRMLDYLRPSDDDLREYFLDYGNQIMVFTHDTPKEVWERQSECPVLLMTTQRYIRLSRSKIREYTYWDGGDRSLILVDETPYFKQPFQWDDADLDRIKQAIENKVPDEDDRNDLLTKWNSFAFAARMSRKNGLFHEDKGVSRTLLMTTLHPTRRYDEMLALFDKHRYTLSACENMDNYHDIAFEARAIVESETILAIFEHESHRNNGGHTYSNKCYNLRDNIDKYLNLDAKVIILDGTAEISVQYQLYPEYMEIVDCSRYNRNLSRMTIHLVNAPTGKTTLKQDSQMRNRVTAAVKNYIAERGGTNNGASALFTYQFLKRDFVAVEEPAEGNPEETVFGGFPENMVEYFGNIRGKNDFRTCKTIFQVGLNIWQDTLYMLYDVANEYFEREHVDSLMEEVRRGTPFMNECRVRELLAELEQNIFRGTIRNSNADDEYHYYLLMPFHGKRDFRAAIEKRFSSLGAHIEYDNESIGIETFEDYLTRCHNTGKETNPAKIIEYHESLPDGTEYTASDIKNTTGLSTGQINKIKENNKSIREALASEDSGTNKCPKVYVKMGSWLDREFYA